ncbi:MAG: DUF1499 domain-containing protein [Pseudomonadota bacterium]
MKYVLIGVVLLLVLGVGAFFYLGQKSQSGEAAGLVDGRLSPCPSSPNCVSSEANTEDEKKVATLSSDSWAQIPGAITDMGGVVTTENATYIAAEFTSKTFKFVDDVEFRLAEDGVHVRSASRVGYSDRGVNSARVAALRAKLDQ